MIQDAAARRKLHVGGRFAGLSLLGIHLGALAIFIPGTFSWSAVAVAVVLYYVTTGLGISLAFHRTLTHRSIKSPIWFEYFITFCGTLALQNGPIEWVATHRAHHAHSDRDGDPHDVRRGLGWAHVAWLYRRNEARLTKAEQRKMAADLYRVPFYRFLDNTYPYWQIALGLALLAIGGWPWVIWGGFVRLVVTYHVTWLVNSAAHHNGYRTYRTNDKSTNNWWVALLTWGEGWHNNHHAFPFSARHGLRGREIDLTWYSIRLLALVKLAREIKLPTEAMMRLRVTPPGDRLPRRVAR